MRDDMAKVVTERPRRGHGNTSKKTTGQRIRSYDPGREYDGPNRLPVSPGRQYGYDCKEFSDLINPLKRYLRSCVGKPWNKVHSELSRKLDRRSLSGSHIWDHVMGDRDRLLHRRRPSRVLEPAVRVACKRLVRAPENGPDPRTASTVETAVNRRPGRASFVRPRILVRLDAHSAAGRSGKCWPNGSAWRRSRSRSADGTEGNLEVRHRFRTMT